MTPEEAIAKHGLSITSEFVPFSKSRNAKPGADGKPWKSLNWKVTMKKGDREVITTDYSAGIGHCPSYNKKPPANWDRPARDWQPLATAWECENGKPATYFMSGFTPNRSAPTIEPKALDVIHSLVTDADTAQPFEDWCADFGYDTDSRKAEATWKECVDIALKLRTALGDEALRDLTEAFQDY